ncbi:MAG: hypothetical protein EON60_07050 [Alphaproteobacteria bacterium]|nr:MAG: hypothetical protein EON60_07050 [Alphaproteobacteria bacterium]
MPFIKSIIATGCLIATPLYAGQPEPNGSEWKGTIEVLDAGACSVPKKKVTASYQVEFTSPSEFVATPILPVTKLLSPNGVIHGTVGSDGTITTTSSAIVTCGDKEQRNTYSGAGKLNDGDLEFTTTENVCPQYGCSFTRKYKLSKSGI